MSRYLKSLEEESVEHDVSKEIFLGIMMLMLCLGILILNVATPVWRVHRHEPKAGDVVVLYGEREIRAIQRWRYGDAKTHGVGLSSKGAFSRWGSGSGSASLSKGRE